MSREHEAAGTEADKRTLLIVDDDPATGDIIARMATHLGFRVLLARSADEARKLAVGARLDLVISDIEMPDLRGPALLRQLKQQGIACPVLFVSGELTPDNLDDSLGVARAMFLPKPFTQRELTDAIWAALKL